MCDFALIFCVVAQCSSELARLGVVIKRWTADID